MKLHSIMEVRGELLLVVFCGEWSFNEGWDLLKQTYDAALEERVNLILVDTLAVDGKLTTFDRYQLATETVAHFRSDTCTQELRWSESRRLRTDSACSSLRIGG
jgi:hypothetical protein